jgi:hypothetical protein
MSETQAVADRQAISERIYRYCRAVDRLDVPLGHSIFHEDATADYGRVYQGLGRGVIDFICKSHLQLTHHSHQITNVTITLEGDRAGSEAYAMVATRLKKGDAFLQMNMWTRYLDRWSKRDGEWAIDKRFMVIDLDEVREIKPLGNEERGLRNADDPSYAFLDLSRKL